MADKRITPLQKVLLSGSLTGVKFILTTDFLKNKGVIKVNRCREVIAFLLDQKNNYNIHSSNYSTLLHFAAMNRDNESFHLLLENSNIDVNAVIPRTKTTLLHVVAMQGTHEMAKALLERGANVNAVSAFNLTPLHFACSNVRMDFSTGSMRTQSSELLKDPKVVQLLLEHGSALEIKTFCSRETPLLLSCQGGNLEIFELLLQYGADFHVTDRIGQNVLHRAVEFAHPSLIKIILDKGFDSNRKDNLGRTHIHEYYSYNGLPEVLDILIKYGADINSRDHRDNTPLHTACTKYFGGSVLYKYFLKRNPDINALNKSGETPLNVALQSCDLYADDNRSVIMVEVSENLCEHIAKLKAADKYICKENLFLVKNDPKVKEIYKKFELELNKMKEEKISSSSHFCYFYILKASPQKLAAFARNDKIMKSLASEKYKEMFPLYSNSLTESINVAISRRELTETCASRLRKHVKRNLPHLIVDNIFYYLSEEDLKNFEEAFMSVRK